MQQINLRTATRNDLPTITSIYSNHVLSGTGSFEEVPPGINSMRERYVAVVEAGYPWLIAELDAEIVGYAFAAPWNSRSAYRFTVEDSIYVADGHMGRGIGSRLLGCLIERCKAEGYLKMMAVAGDGGNTGSVALHCRHGFRVIGTAHGIGLKFGRWLDVVYLQRTL